MSCSLRTQPKLEQDEKFRPRIMEECWLARVSQKCVRPQQFPLCDPSKAFIFLGQHCIATRAHVLTSGCCKLGAPSTLLWTASLTTVTTAVLRDCSLTQLRFVRLQTTLLLPTERICFLPCSHMLSQGPPLQSEIYLRGTFDDSSWMAAQT